MTKQGVCAFCGGTPLNREHVWPGWLRTQVFPQLGAGGRNTLTGFDEHGQMAQTSWKGLPFSHRAYIVCGKSNDASLCNGGWMKQLEDDVIPILKPMILGSDSVELDATRQALISLWTMKTLMMVQRAHRLFPQNILRRDYHALYRQRHPRSQVRIWITPYSQPQRLLFHSAKPLPPPPYGQEGHAGPRTHIETFNIHNLAFHVLGHFHYLKVLDYAPVKSALFRIWPPSADQVWPRDPAITDSVFEYLVNLGAPWEP
jgi:hypothetical protein